MALLPFSFLSFCHKDNQNLTNCTMKNTSSGSHVLSLHGLVARQLVMWCVGQLYYCHDSVVLLAHGCSRPRAVIYSV